MTVSDHLLARLCGLINMATRKFYLAPYPHAVLIFGNARHIGLDTFTAEHAALDP